MDQELGIVAHDVSNRISELLPDGLSQPANIIATTGVAMSLNIMKVIDLPDLVGGKPYTLVTSYDAGTKTGTVKVSYGMNDNVNRSVSFRIRYM